MTVTKEQPRTSDRLVPLACLLGAGALIGLSTDLAKVATDDGLSASSFLTWSVLGAAIVLGIVGGVRRRLPRWSREVAKYSTIAAVVSIVVPQLIFFSAVPLVGASFVALSIAFPPLYTYLGALALGNEQFNPRRAAGVTIAFAGAVLLAAFQLSQPDAEVGWIMLTLTGPIVLAIGNLYRTIAWPEGLAPDELAPAMLAAGAAILIALSALPMFSLGVDISDAGHIGVIAAQTTTFCVQYWLFFILQQRGGPVYLSLLGSVAAVVGSAIAIILLNETAPAGLVPAGVAIAVGITLLTIGQPKPDTEEAS